MAKADRYDTCMFLFCTDLHEHTNVIRDFQFDDNEENALKKLLLSLLQIIFKITDCRFCRLFYQI